MELAPQYQDSMKQYTATAGTQDARDRSYFEARQTIDGVYYGVLDIDFAILKLTTILNGFDADYTPAPNKWHGGYSTLLCVAIVWTKEPNIVRLLLNAGADPRGAEDELLLEMCENCPETSHKNIEIRDMLLKKSEEWIAR